MADAGPAPAAPPAPRPTDDLAFATAGEIAEAIRTRRASSLEMVDLYLARVERLNPQLNAIVTLVADRARERAREADRAAARGEWWGPLHGVPVTVKDVFATAGVRTTAGYPPLVDHVPDRDAVAVARLLGAGAILLGKSNTAMLAMDWQTNNPLFGVTNNPHDVTRTPGSSSGGSSAAIAAGLAALELGSDIGGSIRVPAHFAGVCGLKPTEGRVSGSGHIPELPGFPRTIRHMNCVGPLARSVDDLELAFRVLAGDGTDWEGAPVPPDPVAQRPLDSLTLDWTDDFGGLRPDAATRTAMERLAGELAERGARVSHVNGSGYDFAGIWETWAELAVIEMGAGVPDEVVASFGEQLEAAAAAGFGDVPMVRAWLRYSEEATTPRRYATVLGRRDAVVRGVEELLTSCDAILCPVAAGPAIPHSPPGAPVQVDGSPVPYWLAVGGFTTPFNLSGNPVVVLPMALTEEGLPLGVQIVGRRWREMELLAVARAVAEVLPPLTRPPLATAVRSRW